MSVVAAYLVEKAVALRAAAVGRVERAVKANQPLGHGALRDLICRMEGIVHVHAGEREPVVRISLAIVGDEVPFVVIVRDRPRPVGVNVFGRNQKIAGSHWTRDRAEPAGIAEHAGAKQGESCGRVST